MFDMGFFEIVLIAAVGLLVLGPERLPHAVRMGAAYWGRLKRRFIETKAELEEQLALEDIRRQIKAEQTKLEQDLLTKDNHVDPSDTSNHSTGSADDDPRL
mgnify:CR=1 FL=1